MIFGSHPLDGENTRMYYGRMMDEIKVKIASELESMQSGKLKDPDCGFMGYIFALNQLATEDENIFNLSIYTEQVKEWETTYLVPEFKSITLMRWIRMGIESGDGSFILLR